MDIKKLLRTNYAPIFFVCAAFSLMVVIGSFSVGRVIQKEALSTVTVALNETEKTIRAYLREPKIAFDNIYTAVQDLIDRGESQEVVVRYLEQTTDLLKNQEMGVIGFNSVYGYIRDEFINGSRIDLGEDYVPQQRPWYQLALRSTAVEYTEPYIDADTGVMIISLAQKVFGRNGDYYGVLSLDVDISWLMEYAESLQFSEGGYGIIVNQYLYTIAHPQEEFRNLPLSDFGSGYAEVSEMLRTSQSVSAKNIRDVDGTKIIVFFEQLYNGWFVGVMMPVGSYFSDLYFSIFVLAILGIVLASILSYILLRLSAAKMQSEEESRSKSSFLAHMSHEIRTPMNAILGMTELILQKELSPDAREDAYAIKQASTNLLSIINDILDFSKIGSEKLEITSAEYALSSLMNDVISIIRMRMKKDVLLVANMDSMLPSVLTGDVVRLRQIILNLLSNAVKYTQEGYVSIAVEGELLDDDTIMLSFEVTDTGIGIKQEDMGRLFGEFTQFDIHKNQGVEGTGLGLAITHRLCRLMGGDITVFSRYGIGSIFTATIPQKIADSTRFAEVHYPKAHRVLIYETRVPYANSIACSIDNLGVKCILATTKEDLSKALLENEFSFIFAASFLFHEAREITQKLASNATLVLLSEFGEVVVKSKVHTIAMPAHSVSIANIINGVSDKNTYIETDRTAVSFTAPEAQILIVDDITTNLTVAKGLMSAYCAKIDCCTSGREAIELIKTREYDLVFMDHMMPEMDGIEATAIIRSFSDPRFQRLPIIALTANAVAGTKEMFLEKKFSDYLSKPIEIKKLYEILERWIPKEKREGEKYQTPELPLVTGCSIRGIDIEQGISMTGGSREVYIEVLEMYCQDVSERMEFLREPLKEGNLSLFTTHVHALKSASASIGATEISKQAASLEDAGWRGDTAAICEHINVFLEDLSDLVENIRSALPAMRETGESDAFLGACDDFNGMRGAPEKNEESD